MARTPTKKTCTKCGTEGAIGKADAKANAFYRDKSQKDGHSPWCKACEKGYNSAYYSGLKKVEVARVRDIEDDADAATFEKSMKPVRVKRKSRTQGDGAVRKSTAKTRTVARKRARKNKATETQTDAS